MKTLTAGMIADLQSDTQTFNSCWQITRTDGAAFYFTDSDQPIVFGGHTYSSIDGYAPSQTQGSADFSVDHVEVISFLDSSSISEADLMAGKWDDAVVQMFMVNRKNLANGAYQLRYGVLGQVEITSPGQFKAELRGLLQYLQKQIVQTITPTCRWDLGSNTLSPTPGQSWGLCTINLATFAVTGVAVTTVVSNQSFIATSLGQPAGYFQGGTLTWTTGLNTGRTMDIQASSGAGAIVLQLPMLNNIGIGDLATLYPGCQKRFAQDCVTKFANGINFGGFKDLPGIDKMIRPGGV